MFVLKCSLVHDQTAKLILQNEQLLLQNNKLLDELSLSKIGDGNLDETFYQPLTGFPINTLEQFDFLNNKEQKSLRKTLVRKLL